MFVLLEKKIFRIASWSLVLLYLARFLIFYLPYFVFNASSGFWYYFDIFFQLALDFIIPVISAALLLFCAAKNGRREVLLPALFLSLPRLVYSIPYGYLRLIISEGYDSIESITLSFLMSLAVVLLNYLHILLLAFSSYFFMRRLIARRAVGDRCAITKDALLGAEGELYGEICAGGAFNLARPFAAGLFASSFIQFFINVITVITEQILPLIINYNVGSIGDIRPEELFTMLGSFALILVMMLASHAAAHFTLIKIRGESNDENND